MRKIITITEGNETFHAIENSEGELFKGYDFMGREMWTASRAECFRFDAWEAESVLYSLTLAEDSPSAQFIGKRLSECDFIVNAGRRVVIMAENPGKFPSQVFVSFDSGDVAPDVMNATIKDCYITPDCAKILI